MTPVTQPRGCWLLRLFSLMHENSRKTQAILPLLCCDGKRTPVSAQRTLSSLRVPGSNSSETTRIFNRRCWRSCEMRKNLSPPPVSLSLPFCDLSSTGFPHFQPGVGADGAAEGRLPHGAAAASQGVQVLFLVLRLRGPFFGFLMNGATTLFEAALLETSEAAVQERTGDVRWFPFEQQGLMDVYVFSI